MGGRGAITEESARALGRVVKWYGPLKRGKRGVPENVSTDADQMGGIIGQATQPIQAGSSGLVMIYTGKKGQEASSGVTTTVYNRTATLNQGDWVIFYEFDGGYENFAPGSGGSGNQQQQQNKGCNCLNCGPPTYPTTTACSVVNPSLQYWSVDTTNFPTTCNSGPTGSAFVLTWQSGCTWTSPNFLNLSNQILWVLNVASPYVTLTLQVDANHSIQYRCALIEWSGWCTNTMTLASPSQFPSGCIAGLPCTVCVTPAQLSYCGACPSTGNNKLAVTFPATGTGDWADLQGTFELQGQINNLPGRSGCGYCLSGLPVAHNWPQPITMNAWLDAPFGLELLNIGLGVGGYTNIGPFGTGVTTVCGNFGAIAEGAFASINDPPCPSDTTAVMNFSWVTGSLGTPFLGYTGPMHFTAQWL